MRTFHLQRHQDPSGVSGVGRVAEGVQFSDQTCVLRWLTGPSSTGVYRSIADVIELHGHNGKTVVVYTN